MPDGTWSNWAGSLYANPAQLPRPASVADLQAIVRQNQGRTLRAAGTGHSWSPLVPTTDVLIDPTGITDNGRKAWRWQKGDLNLVTFLPSAAWADVRDALTESDPAVPRLFLPTAGVVPSINATGFVAAGCHGTGWAQPTVPDLIYAIEFVGADGQVHVFSEDTTPNEMAAARVSLGMLGLITSITLKVDPMYRLWDQELIKPTADVMGPNPAETGGNVYPAALSRLVTGNDYVELFWFPWSGSGILHPTELDDGYIWVKQWNHTQDPPRDIPAQTPSWEDFVAALVMEQVAENTPVGAPAHWTIPVIEWGLWQSLQQTIQQIEQTNGFVAEAPTVLLYQDKPFPIIDLEIALPIPASGANTWDFSNVVRAWYQVVNAVRAGYPNQVYPLTVCMHARFMQNSQALLSPAYVPAGDATHHCWIEILSAYPKAVPDAAARARMIADYNGLANSIAPTWIAEMHGRPHWAKYWQNLPGIDVAALYPPANLAAFNSLRRSLDPGGMFMNDFLKGLRLFGG